jgi:hypothetical protein
MNDCIIIDDNDETTTCESKVKSVCNDENTVDLTNDNESSSNDSVSFDCGICLFRNVGVCIDPCGHLMCKVCCAKIMNTRKCPFCRKTINKKINIYF